jgi:beta-galactosidase
VAIVFNPMSYFIGGRQRQATVIGPQSEVATIERDSMLGVYRALFPANVPVDFIHVNELEGIGQYKLVVLPYPLMLPRKAAPALQAFVRNGGALVSEARLAWMNDGGAASETIPGLGLHEVFACRETAVETVPGLRTEILWENGARLPARLYEETLEPLQNGRIVGRFPSGAAAAVEAKYGRGKTLAIGSYLAHGYETQRDPAVQAFFLRLLDWAGVSRAIEVKGGAEVRWLESGNSRLLFAFNHGNRPSDVSIRFPGAWTATDLITGTRVDTLVRTIGAEDVWVVHLTAR